MLANVLRTFPAGFHSLFSAAELPYYIYDRSIISVTVRSVRSAFRDSYTCVISALS